MSDPRLQAVLMLQEILEQRTFASEVKNRADSAAENDAAFINMLLQTALRHMTSIKKLLKTFIKKKLPASARFGHYALILGSTELLYLNTPDYAIINSYVELTKKHTDKYIGGFVNAVLRKVCAARESFRGQNDGEFFPPEFRRLLNAGYGKKSPRRLKPPPLKNPCLTSPSKRILSCPAPKFYHWEPAASKTTAILPNSPAIPRADGGCRTSPRLCRSSFWAS